jgi:hypothetical protein
VAVELSDDKRDDIGAAAAPPSASGVAADTTSVDATTAAVAASPVVGSVAATTTAVDCVGASSTAAIVCVSAAFAARKLTRGTGASASAMTMLCSVLKCSTRANDATGFMQMTHHICKDLCAFLWRSRVDWCDSNISPQTAQCSVVRL